MTFARALNDGEVLSLRDLNSGFSKPETISLSYFQAAVLVELTRYPEAEARLVDLLALRRQLLGDAHPNTRQNLQQLVDLYQRWGKSSEAEHYRQQLP